MLQYRNCHRSSLSTLLRRLMITFQRLRKFLLLRIWCRERERSGTRAHTRGVLPQHGPAMLRSESAFIRENTGVGLMVGGERRIISSSVFLTYRDHGFIGSDKGISVRRNHFRLEDQSWIATRHFGVTNVMCCNNAVFYAKYCNISQSKSYNVMTLPLFIKKR